MPIWKTTLIFLASASLYAAPKGGSVAKGEAFIKNEGNKLSIEAADQTVIHWKDFSISKGELVKFIQPHAQAAVINKVIQGKLSEIYGTLEANGKVYLINPAGILVGKEGMIHTAGFIASTFDFTMDKEGRLFKGDSQATVVNHGTIQTPHGDVFLIGYEVQNSGEIQAGGTVGLASGNAILLVEEGNDRVMVRTENPDQIQSRLKDDGNSFAFAIKNDGYIEAAGVVESEGAVYLIGDGGVISHEGTIVAHGKDVHLIGEAVECLKGSLIDTSSEMNGGNIELGKNYVLVQEGAEIVADSHREGNGGDVFLFGEKLAAFHGMISTRGGRDKGNGGFVEVSGLESLQMTGFADRLAPNGISGELVIDPNDIDIVAGAAFPDFTFGGACGLSTFCVSIPPGTSPAPLGATAITTNLGLGPVTVTTGTGAFDRGEPGNIRVLSPVTWATANPLTIIANNNIDITADIQCTSTGAVTVQSLGGNIHLDAATALAQVLVGSQGGVVTVEALVGDVRLTAGAGNGIDAAIGYSSGNSSGDIFVVAGNDLLMFGGSGTNFNNCAGASIGRLTSGQVGNVTGNMNVNVANDCRMLGGSGAGANPIGGPAFIGHGAGLLNGNDTRIGDIFLNVGNNLDMEGGAEGVAVIGTINRSNGTVVNDIFINVGRNAYMHDPGGSNGFSGAFIGGSNFAGGWRQNCYMNVGENLTMDARDGGYITFQIFNDFGDYATEGFTQIHVGGDMTMIAGNSPGGASPQCYVLLHMADMTTEVWVNGNIRCYNGQEQSAMIAMPWGQQFQGFNGGGDWGLVDIRAGGNLIMGGGGPPLGAFFPNQVFTSQDQSARLEADAAFLNGQLWAPQTALVNGANIFVGTPLQFASGNQSTVNPGVVGGDGLGGFAIDTAIYNFANPTSVTGPSWNTSSPTAPAAPLIPAALGLSYNTELGIQILSADRFADGTPCDLLIGDRNTPNALELTANNGDVIVDHFRDIVIQPRTTPLPTPNPITFTTGDVLIIANNDITMDPNASITSAEDLTLVVDNQAPVPPLIGGVWSPAGRFLMDPTASLVSGTGPGGDLRVFTALQAANSILGTLNGALFFPGTRFVDTDIEHWCIYYPHPFVGPIYTIFYKPCEGFAPQAQRVIDELFFDLHGVDEYLGWPEQFRFVFYQDMHNLWTVFNNLSDEKYYLRRKYYSMNNPRSAEDFIELYKQENEPVE